MSRKLSTRFPHVLQQDIRLSRPFGSGSFGTVYLGLWFSTRVAVKQIHNSLAPSSHEIWVGEHTSHPNVVQVYGSCPGKIANTTWLLMEVCDKQDLFKQGKKMRSHLLTDFPKVFRQILRCLLDVVCALEYLHANGICHGDLKCGNVLCQSSVLDSRGFVCKVGDFGMAVVREKELKVETHPEQTAATLFMSPEQLRGQRVEKACDVYAFGMLAWHMLCGDGDEAQLPDSVYYFRVVEEEWRPLITEIVPEEYKDIIVSCWDTRSELRPTFRELRGRLIAYLDREYNGDS